MRRLYVFFLVLVLPGFVSGQQFHFGKITVATIDSLQSKDKATRVSYDYPVGVSADYFPNRNQFSLAQPISYDKKIGVFDFETSYYFSKNDSIVRLIEYSWQGAGKSGTAEYYKTIKANKEKISKHFKAAGKEVPATEENAAKTIWENELVYVEQFVIPRSYRIRVLISWK